MFAYVFTQMCMNQRSAPPHQQVGTPNGSAPPNRLASPNGLVPPNGSAPPNGSVPPTAWCPQWLSTPQWLGTPLQVHTTAHRPYGQSHGFLSTPFYTQLFAISPPISCLT